MLPACQVSLVLRFCVCYPASSESELCFRPLFPALDIKMYIIWKKYQVFSKPAELLLDVFKRRLNIEDLSS